MHSTRVPPDTVGQAKQTGTSDRLRALWPLIVEMIRPRRHLLAVGLVLMVVNRLAGLVLPASIKFLIDDVIGKQRRDLLEPLVLAVILATAVQGATSFALTQSLSKAAQRLIAELRRKVQAHVGRLPVAYYDANKSGALVSRIMTDVEGVRNLLGTGWVEFAGGLLTAVFALGILIRISLLLTGLSLFLFRVPLKGSFLTLSGAALLYVMSATAFGLLISAFVRSQVAALLGTAILSILPAVQFSGLVEPVSSLEGAGAFIGRIFPTTHFLTIARGTFSKGLGFTDLRASFVPLAIAAPVLIVLAAVLLRKQER